MALEKPTFLQQEKKVENPEDYILKSFPGIENEILEFYKRNKDKVKPSYLEQAASFYKQSVEGKGYPTEAEMVINSIRKKMDGGTEAGADKQQMKLNLNRIYMTLERRTMNLGEKSEQELQETLTTLEKTLEAATILNDKMKMTYLTTWKNQITDELGKRIKQAM